MKTVTYALFIAALPFSAQAAEGKEAVQQAPSVASDTQQTNDVGAVVVTGTRRSQRSQFETMAPVDVITAEEVRAVESSDMNDVLAQLLPSFVVQRLPMNDGLVFVRPATLRGLSPDQTLVLVNGKRFHRSAFIGARGAQAVDLSRIPVAAVKRIEVLRDGASAQYGSDAIAGVINIILDDSTASEIGLRLSGYSEGDGQAWRVLGKTGFALGGGGTFNAFAQAENSKATSRTRQRPDAIAFQAAHPALAVPNPVQRWGQPDLQDRHVGFNTELALGVNMQLYGYGLYSRMHGVSDFNWRNPDGTASVYNRTAVFPGWDVHTLYPVGFTPRYGTRERDTQLTGGVRGQAGDRLHWDVSIGLGRSTVAYTLASSLNASLGPQSPTRFELGQLAQNQTTINADATYALPVAAFSSPLNIAFGAEVRSETFSVRAGDAASYAVGPGAAAGLAPNSNGAPGFSAQQAGRWTQRSQAAYLDMEAEILPRWSLGAAVRREHFPSFGNSTNGKVSTRYEFTPGLAARATWATGFRAPTPGQIHSTSTVQGLDTVTLQVFTAGRLSPNDPIAAALGAKALKPETSRSLSAGLAWQAANGWSATLDLYDIKVRQRFSQSASFAVPAALPNPMRYTSVSFFTNDFDTTTRGADLVLGWRKRVAAGVFNTSLSWNYNRTRVDAGRTSVASNTTQRILYEERLPRQKGSLGLDFDAKRHWGVGARVRHYGAWTDATGNATGDIYQRFSAITFVDLSLRWKSGVHELRLGADNLFNTYPDEAVFQASRGLVYSRNSPYDTDGRNLYLDYRVKF